VLDVNAAGSRMGAVYPTRAERQMAFINERIDTPETIREFDGLKLVSPVTGGPPERWMWTVDRERGVYLVSLGGGFGDMPRIFALVLPEGTVRIEGRSSEQGAIAARAVEIEWNVSAVRIPRALASRTGQILALVREALDAHGMSFDREPVRSVKISLPTATLV
jgi:hypothetical protein